MCPITPVPIQIYALLSNIHAVGTCHMYPLTPSLTPSLMSWGDLSYVWNCRKDVKLPKRYQILKSKSQGLWRRFTKNWHNEVHRCWCQFWHHIWWWPKTLKMCKESIFDQFWWPSYLMSKLTAICVTLNVSIYFLWTSSIVHVFDFLTFDIFLTIWHLFDNLTSFWYFYIFLTFLHLFKLKPHQPIKSLFFLFNTIQWSFKYEFTFLSEELEPFVNISWTGPIYWRWCKFITHDAVLKQLLTNESTSPAGKNSSKWTKIIQIFHLYCCNVVLWLSFCYARV